MNAFLDHKSFLCRVNIALIYDEKVDQASYEVIEAIGSGDFIRWKFVG